MNILTIEASTTSAKAILFNSHTNKYRIHTEAFQRFASNPTLHNPEVVFEKVTSVAKKVICEDRVDLISISGTWHNVFLAEKQYPYKPVMPAYLWSNMEAANICSDLRSDKMIVEFFYKKTGCMVNAIYPAFKILLFKEKGYDLKEYLIFDQGSYMMFQLTDTWLTSDSMASGTGFMNISDLRYDEEILAYLGIYEEQLPKIVDYKKTVPLSKIGANILGVDQGIPVIPPCPDGGLNQIGSMAMEEGIMTCSVGTSGALRLSSNEPKIPKTPSTWCYRFPKAWLSGAAISGATNCVDWFKGKMFDETIKYEEIENKINFEIEPPIFLPFLYGERAPGWNDKRSASFNNLNSSHSKYEMYHSILVGVLFNLYQNYSILTDMNGDPIKIKLSGGILKSKIWTQMCADIFGKELIVDDIDHASLLGGVILGKEILGILDNNDEDEKNVQKIKPNMDSHKYYMELFKTYLYYYNLE